MGAAWKATLVQLRIWRLRSADWAGEASRSVPGAGGAVCVSWGLGQVYRPLWWLSIGMFLLAMDRRMA